MASGVVRRRLGLNGVSDPSQGMSAQAHDPAQEQLLGGNQGTRREGGLKLLDKGVQRGYHLPHGGFSFSLRNIAPQRIGSSPSLSPFALALREWPSVLVNMRESSARPGSKRGE